MSSRQKIIIVTGTNASGKSSLAIRLAMRYQGEIISADSRQVYRGLNIGSGKVSKYEQRQIPHHMLDIASPKRQFSVSQFVSNAKKEITRIQKRKHVPIVCGGTGFWIDALALGYSLPHVSPNHRLRKRLEIKSAYILFRELQKKDVNRSKRIDSYNKRRLIRALEIIAAEKKPIRPLRASIQYDTLWIGVTFPLNILRKRIRTRLYARMRQGMVSEVQRLHASGVSWNRLESLGLEYRFVSDYLQKRKTKKEMLSELEKAIVRYAKRQMTWFKRNPRIHWVTSTSEAQVLVKKFLSH